MVARQEISDETWATLEPLLAKPKGRGRPMMDLRSTVGGITWRFRTGAPWRDVPERFGHWNSIYQRFADWSADGTWARMLATVESSAASAGAVNWTVSVDSTITRVHQHGAPLTRDTGGRIELQEARRPGAT
jgi:transposase